jgi:hypothetical protein
MTRPAKKLCEEVNRACGFPAHVLPEVSRVRGGTNGRRVLHGAAQAVKLSVSR